MGASLSTHALPSHPGAQADASTRTMERVISGLLRLTFSDSEIDGLCNDLSTVFDERSFPDDSHVTDLTLRMRGALHVLIGAARDPRLLLRPTDASTLAEAVCTARAHLDLESPSSPHGLQPRVILVRLARVVSDLLDTLGSVNLLEEADLLDEAEPPSCAGPTTGPLRTAP